MKTTWESFSPKPFLVINPGSGNADPQTTADIFSRVCKQQEFPGKKHILNEGEDITRLTSQAVDDGYDVILAAGGDGTVSATANGLIGKEAVLGIVPTGTGNGLAKALGIPLDPIDAIQMIGDKLHIQKMDILLANDRYAILNVSAGISAEAMQHTNTDSKKIGGMLAYVQSFARTIQEMDTYRFQLCIDGAEVEVEASEVILSNGSLLNDPPFDIYGQRGDFFDGEMEFQIIRAGEMDEYISLSWELLVEDNRKAEKVRVERASHSVSIRVSDERPGVQMDGDVYGHTPVSVQLLPASLPILLPS